MDKENILKIVEKAIEIGGSSEHYVSIAVSLNPLTFPVDVYIHNIDHNGMSAGIADRRCFCDIDNIELHEDWFARWSSQIRKERAN